MAGNCKEALPALQRAESLNAKLSNPWLFSGYCYFALHQSPRALQSLHRAILLNPQDPNAWFFTAQVSSDLGHLEDALEAVVRSDSLGMKTPEVYYLAGKDTLELASRFYDRVTSASSQPDLYSWLLDGQRNSALGVWEPAIQEYQQALKIAPERPDLNFAIGTAYLEKGQYGDAEKSLRRCLDLAPESTWARLRLVLALVRQSKQDEALRLFRAVSTDQLQSPSEYRDYLFCGYLLRLSTATQQALAQARQRFRYDGDWDEWTARLASLTGGATEKEPAPLKLEALTGVGLSLRFFLTANQRSGNRFEAMFPSPSAYQGFQSDFLRGQWMKATGKIVPLTKAVQPAELAAARALAMGEILQSLSYGFYEQLGLEFPDSAPAMELAAENLIAAGERKKALEIYQGIAQKDGPSPDIFREIARIYWGDHEWEKALEVLQPLAQMDPNDATLFVNIGRIYAFEAKLESAAEAFRRAIQLQPNMSEAHFGLGQALRKQGDLPGAVQECKRASQLDPSDPGPHYALSQIYKQRGEKNLAAEEMESFQHLRSAENSEVRRRNKTLVPLE